MPTLGQLAAEMTGSMPGLSNLYARKFINQALEEMQTDYLWSWMIGEGILIIPTAVAAGTATVTYLSNQVQFDATAMAAIAAFGTNPPVTQCQFRVPSSGPVYNITAYNTGTGIATLDRLYTEPSGVGQEYTIYQIYFNPPSVDGTTPNTDFLRYLSILNPINGYSITGNGST